MSHAFTTIKAARSIGRRHPDVPAYVAAVGLAMASYADGRHGTMIRPRLQVVAQELGMSLSQVRRAVRWLESHDELRRDKTGWRGSAACFTWLGGMEVADDPLSELKGVAGATKGGRGRPPTNQTSQRPTEPSVPPVSETGESAGEPEGTPARFTCARKGCENEVRREGVWCAPCMTEWDEKERQARQAKARQPIPAAWMNVEGG